MTDPVFEEVQTPPDERLQRRRRFAALLGAFGLVFVGVSVVVESVAPLAFAAVLLAAGAVVGILAIVGGRYASLETVVDDDGVRVRRTLGDDVELSPADIRDVRTVEDVRAADAGRGRSFGRRAFLSGAFARGQPGVAIATQDGETVVPTDRPEELTEAVDGVLEPTDDRR